MSNILPGEGNLIRDVGVLARMSKTLEAAKRILRCAPGTLIIFLTRNDDREVMRAARGDGARGYVLKINAATKLLSAIYTALPGDHFFNSGIASDLRE